VNARRTLLLLIAIVTIGIAIRLPAFLHEGLWRDQANVFVEVTAPDFRTFLHRVMATDWHPPLYFLAAYVWTKVFGTSEWSFQSLSFLFGIATIVVTYLLAARAAASQTAGLVAAALFAVSPLAIAYASEYVYPMACFFFTLLTLLVVLARREPMTAFRWIAIAIVSMLAVYTHYTALIFIPLLAAWSLWPVRGLRHATAVCSALIGGMLTFAVWLPVLRRQLDIGIPYAVHPTAFGKLQFVEGMLLYAMSARSITLQWTFIALLLAGLVLIARKRRLNPDACACGAIFLVLLLLETIGNLTVPRYVLGAVALLYSFCGWIVTAALPLIVPSGARTRRWLGALGVALGIAFVAGDVQYALKLAQTPKSGIRTYLRAQAPDAHSLYVLAPDYLASTFAFYAQGTPVDIHGFVRWNRPQIFTLDGYVRDWRDPEAVSRALAAVERQAGRHDALDFIMDATTTRQAWHPYAKAWRLLIELERRYSLTADSCYAGRNESICVYHFRFHPS
jgi:hypothetical protein